MHSDAAATASPRRVRFNAESFGFLVGFPEGDIVLAGPGALAVLRRDVSRAELEPFVLDKLPVIEPFYLNTPALVWIELTRRCDLACPHCYINGGPRRRGEMSTERFVELIDEMADMGVWGVAFTGGEPTLHPDFAYLVRHARSRDLLVGIATHGLHLTDELLDELPSDGVIVSVSIDDLHVGRRGHDVSTERAQEAILRAQRHGFLTNVMTNTHRQNVHRLGEIMGWAEEHGVSIRSVPFSPIGRGRFATHLENVPADVERAAEFWIRECEWEHEYHRKAGLCVGLIFNYGLTLGYMTRRCSSGRFLAYVAADGTVYPCTMTASEDILAGGDVAERSFAEVWRDDWQIRHFNWDNFHDTCEGCPISDEAQYYCSSRCPAMSHARHGTLFDCGASEFEIFSTIHRTRLLADSETSNAATPATRHVGELQGLR
jgi:radical SAM protein with 4Fe4S-binding SPASM domain